MVCAHHQHRVFPHVFPIEQLEQAPQLKVAMRKRRRIVRAQFSHFCRRLLDRSIVGIVQRRPAVLRGVVVPVGDRRIERLVRVEGLYLQEPVVR